MDNQSFFQQTTNAIVQYLWQELTLKPGVHYRFAQRAQGGPRVLSLSIFVNPRYGRKIASMGEALSMAARLDKNATIRIGRGHRGTLCFEIPKPEDLWYNVSLDRFPPRRGLTATVGLDGEHRPALVNFANPLTPHLGVFGSTGCGKTNAQRLLVHSLARQNTPEQLALILIDTRKRGSCWKPFSKLPHLLHPIVKNDNEAARVLSWAVAEIDRRAESGRTKPSIFVAVDEMQSLLTRPDLGQCLKDLTAVGREYNIRFIGGLQNPTSAMMGGSADLKRNVVSRLVGKCDSGTSAVVASGMKESGCELLVGAGDFVHISPGSVKRLTACLLTEKDTDKLPRADSVKTLDLSQYEDVDHIIEQADLKPGRRQDALSAQHVAYALIHAKTTQRELNRQFSIGFEKAKRVLTFASELRSELLALTATKRNNHIVAA